MRPEDKLLLYCARRDVGPEIKENIAAVINEEFDWQYLLGSSFRK